MCRALREHFNYDYAYNYFFNPEKIKGLAYKPMNEELLNATLDKYRKTNHWQNVNTENSLPANTHFMDDFSGNAENSKPAGWFFNSRGKHSLIKTIKNQPGKWVQLGVYNDFFPTTLRKPIPENFSLEFDVATDEFNVRTGGAVRLYLSSFPLIADGREDKGKARTSITIDITAGNEADYNNNNYSGEAKIKLESNPEVYGEFTYSLREFTNKKNKVHIILTKKGEELKLLVNGKQAAINKDFKAEHGYDCKNCKMPAGTKFNTLTFQNRTNDWNPKGSTDDERVDVYISNVKITKE